MKDKSRALVTYIQCRAYPGGKGRVIRLRGLDPDAVYEDCRPSPNDPNQGWLMEDDAEEYDEYEEW